MIVCTSISPKHNNAASQVLAIESWKSLGECFSLNCKSEIEILKPLYPNITFIETPKTIRHIIGKDVVNINAFFDFAIEKQSDMLITNSDIILKDLPEFRQDGVTMFTRYDYTESVSETKKFTFGYDVFYVPKEFLNVFPVSIYAMGVAFWDHALPLRCIEKSIPLYYPKGEFAFHKWHHTQYNYREWLDIAEYFRLDFKLDKRLSGGQIATNSMTTISGKLIYV